MPRRSSFVLAVATVLLALPVGARAQDIGRKSLLGRVWIGTQPGIHIAVLLENQYRTEIARDITDRDGRFAFHGLHGGPLTLEVREPGYQTLLQAVDLGEAGEEMDVTLFLRPAAKSRTPAPSLGRYSLTAKAQAGWTAAQAMIQQQRYKDAVGPLNQTLAAAPDFADGYTVLGDVNWALNHHDRAANAWAKALALDPKQTEAAINLARYHNDRREWASALRTLGPAPTEASAQMAWRLQRGRAEYGLAEWAGAFADLSASLPEAAQSDPAVYVLLSNLDLRANRLPEARAMLESYLRAAPKGRFAPRARAIVGEMVARGVPEPAAP